MSKNSVPDGAVRRDYAITDSNRETHFQPASSGEAERLAVELEQECKHERGSTCYASNALPENRCVKCRSSALLKQMAETANRLAPLVHHTWRDRAEQAEAEIKDLNRELESTAELAAQQGRDCLKAEATLVRAQELVNGILATYAEENTREAMDACEHCSKLVMCKFHSVLSLLSGGTQLEAAALRGAEEPK